MSKDGTIRVATCWHPSGLIILQAENHLFRIDDQDGLFSHLESSTFEDDKDARLIMLDAISKDDLEALLTPAVPFTRLSAAIKQLYTTESPYTPPLRGLALAALLQRFPSRTFAPNDHAEDALILAVKFALDEELRKRLWYHVVTTREFHDDDIETATLPPELRTRCKTLLDALISHFTALLFTPPPTSHMACTDVIAASWMEVVIQPSLENDGVYKPLESLDMMKTREWEKLGVCSSCVKDKEAEWDEEADTVWRLLGGWIQDA